MVTRVLLLLACLCLPVIFWDDDERETRNEKRGGGEKTVMSAVVTDCAPPTHETVAIGSTIPQTGVCGEDIGGDWPSSVTSTW